MRIWSSQVVWIGVWVANMVGGSRIIHNCGFSRCRAGWTMSEEDFVFVQD